MTRAVWDDEGQHFYQTGVDRGMLYVGTVAVPWVGLVSVTEDPSGGDGQPFYLDGQKVLNVPAGEDFNATIESFAFPIEFASCAGRFQLGAGLYATDQPKTTFGFSYRTLVGNEEIGTTLAYKIHIVYGATAKLPDFSHETISDSVSAKTISFSVSTVPVQIPGFRPTSHLVVDTRRVTLDILNEIEAILYGDDNGDARLPTPDELVTILNS